VRTGRRKERWIERLAWPLNVRRLCRLRLLLMRRHRHPSDALREALLLRGAVLLLRLRLRRVGRLFRRTIRRCPV